MRAGPENQEWYFFKSGSYSGLKAGPFSWDQLRVEAQKGLLEPADVVWDPGSGWRTASQVSGLFTAAATPGPAGAFPAAPPVEPPARTRGRVWLRWLPTILALVIVGAGLGVYLGLLRDNDGTGTVATSVQTTTSTASTATTAATTATTAATTATTAAALPVLHLSQTDSGHQVELRAGGHLRIDLKPAVTAKVKAVHWSYQPVAVRQIDSGSNVVGGVVVASWLELQGVVAGPVTIRAQYDLSDGSTRTEWVLYLTVTE